MRLTALILACSITLAAQTSMPSLEQLFMRPYIWGTSPTQPVWSKSGKVLAFLWNAEGRRFRDLYAWNASAKKLVRLTDLEHEKDDLNTPADEKDERRKQYLAPPAGLSSFDISHDGTRVAFAWRGDLYIATSDGTKPLLRLTRTKTGESAPKFSSDGKRLGSIRGGQVIVQDLGTGQIWQATDVQSGSSLSTYDWSPDGRTLLVRVEKAGQRQLPLPNYSGRTVTTRPITRTLAGDEPEQESLFLVPAEGGKVTPVDRGGDKWQLVSTLWSPDGKRIVICQISPDYKQRRILTVQTDTGKSKTVFEEKDPRWVDYGFADWAEDSSQLLFTSERDGWAHLYRVGPDGGDPVQITKGAYEIRNEPFSQDPQWAGGWIWYSSNEGDTAQRQFYRIRPDGSGKEKLSSGEGLHIGIVSEDGRNVAIMNADEMHPFDLWANGSRVTTSPRAGFSQVPWPAVRYVHFPSKGDGKSVAAKILLPPGYDPADKSGKKWPAVVYVHGAGIATSVLKQWGSYNEMRYVFNAWLANRGYVVVDTDYRGSTGYGRDWRSDVYLHMSGKDLDDVLGGVEFLKSLGNVDTGRVGIWGVSYGGFMTAAALFNAPGTFRAGAAWAGVYDWENYNEGYTAQRLNTPASNPEAYKRSSPIYFSNNLQDHLLIVHGMVDDNVLFQDAVQLTEKLIHEGKQFEHIYYPEESHGFVRDETWVDAFRRTGDWLERFLK